MCKPLIDKSTAVIIKAFWKSWLRIFEKPKEILTDNAKEFLSEEFNTFVKQMKTKQTLTSIYHPQSNGKNERSHGILKDYLRHYSSEQEPWDIVLPKATLSYNTTVNRTMKHTLFELQLGYEPNSILKEMDEDETYEQIIQNKKYKHEQIVKEAKENITDAQPSTSYENLSNLSYQIPKS